MGDIADMLMEQFLMDDIDEMETTDLLHGRPQRVHHSMRAHPSNRRPNMNRLRTATYWTDKRGIEHDITKMSDQYVVNTMGYLTRRRKEFDDIEWDVPQITTEMKFLDEWIEIFAEELQRRADLGIAIEREDGCEWGL